ncbi:MAG: DUF6785 family protein [Thermoproteota archaeon]
MSSEVELKSGLTIKSLAISLPLVLIFAYLSVVLGLYTDKTGTFGTFIIPMIYFVVVAELLGRFSPKMRLTPQEYLFIFTVISSLGLHSYLTMHASAHHNPINMPIYGDLSNYVGLMQNEDIRKAMEKAVPAIVIAPEPVRGEIGSMLLNGRVPGQEIPWGYLAPAIVYWGMVYLFYSFISMFVAFTVGKPWIEEERLVFPLALPSLYLFKESEVDPTTNKARLFNLKMPATKVFWGTFLIGALGGILPVVAELWPEFPAAAWWGETKVDIPFLAQAWPGVYASFIFFIPQIAVGLVMPNDALITLIIGWVILGVLWQGISVSAGWTAYTPGMEFLWPWDSAAGTTVMPFPYRWVGACGVAFAIGVWCLYMQRKRFIDVFSSLWKGGEERGLSLRILPILLLVGAIGWYILMLITGGDPLVALLVPLWAFVFNIYYARIFAEVFWHVGTGWGQGIGTYEPFYQLGVALRGWPTVVEWSNPNMNPGWYTVLEHVHNVGNWNVSFSPLSSASMVTIYKSAYELKMRLKDLLIAMIIGIVVLLFVFVPIDVNFMFSTKGGISQLGDIYTWWIWDVANSYVMQRSAPTGLTPEYALGVIWGFGFVLAIALYILRTKVSFFWFISVPALSIAMTVPTYMWMTSLIALIIKYVAIRTVGIKRYEEYVMPVVAGLILGFGAMWLPAALLNLGGVAIPRMTSLLQ